MSQTQDSSHTQDAQAHQELIFITELSMDYEASIVASILESHDVPHVIQGLSHRGMLGVLGAGIVPLRVLAPQAHAERARELIEGYRAQLSEEAEHGESEGHEGDDEGYIPRRRLFTVKSRQLGVALLLGAIIGFGSATLYARLYVLSALLCSLQLLAWGYSSTAFATELLSSFAELLSLSPELLHRYLTLTLQPLELILSLSWITLKKTD